MSDEPREPDPKDGETPVEAATGDRQPPEATTADAVRDPAPEATSAEAAGEPPAPAEAVPAPEPDARGPRLPRRPRWLEERPEVAIEVPRRRLASQSRRDFIFFTAGLAATAAGWWWLLPDRTKARLVGAANRDRLDTLAARVGLSRANREKVLNRTLTFDDDVSEALYSKHRMVRTYRKSDVTPLPNNYHGRTPGPEYLATWTLTVSGLTSGRTERLTAAELLDRFPHHEQVTRLVCVEGWSAIAWWGGIRFADFLEAYPPAAGARWAALRSSVSLDGAGRPEPYYVSLDLDTARHAQTLLATHLGGKPLPLAHGAPLRLLTPVKLGLKNIKALTDIAYGASEPPDYWAERGYSRYDGL